LLHCLVSSGSGKTDTSIPENAQNSAESSDIKLPYSASENALEVIPPSIPVESQNFEQTAPTLDSTPEDTWKRLENEEATDNPNIQGGQL